MSRLDDLRAELSELNTEIYARKKASPFQRNTQQGQEDQQQLQNIQQAEQQKQQQQQEIDTPNKVMQQAESMLQEEMGQPSYTERIINSQTRDERSPIQNITDIFTGNDRQTWESENLPSFYESGIINRLSIPKIAAVTALSQITLDPREFGEIIVNLDPDKKFKLSEDPAGNVILNDTETGKRAMINKPGFDSYDAVQTGSQAAMFTPIGRAASISGMGVSKAIPQLAKNVMAGGATSNPLTKKAIAAQVVSQGAKDAGIQAAQEGIHSQVGGKFDSDEVMLSGGISSGGTALGHGISAASPLWRNIDKTNPTRSQNQQREINRAFEDIDLLENNGFGATTSQIPYIHKETPFRESMLEGARHMPWLKMGERSVEENQRRVANAQRFASRYKEADRLAAYEDLKAGRQKIKTAVGQQLGNIRQDLYDIDMDLSPTLTSIDDTLEAYFKTYKGAERIIDNEEVPVIKLLETMKANLQRDSSYGNFMREKEKLGSKLNKKSVENDALKAEKSHLYSVIKSQDEQIIKDVKPKDLDKYRQLNAKYEELMKQNKMTVIAKVLDKGKIIPEEVDNIVNSNKSEIRIIYNSMTNVGRENMRKSIINAAKEKALDNLNDEFNEESFILALNSMKDGIDIFFKGKEKRSLNELKRILRLTSKQGSRFMTPQRASSFGSAGINPTGAGILIQSAALIAGAGGIATAYESKTVRNALLKLKAARRGSTLYEKRLLELRKYIITALQVSNVSDDENRPYYSPYAINQ